MSVSTEQVFVHAAYRREGRQHSRCARCGMFVLHSIRHVSAGLLELDARRTVLHARRLLFHRFFALLLCMLKTCSAACTFTPLRLSTSCLQVSNKPRITASPQAPVPLLDWAASEGVAPHQLLLCTGSSAERDAWRQGLAEQASPGSPVVTWVQLEDASSPSASACSEPSAVALMPASVSLPDLPRAIAHHALASSTSPDSLTGGDSLTQSKARVTVDSMQSSKPLLLVATQMKASREKELQGMGLLQLVPQVGISCSAAF